MTRNEWGQGIDRPEAVGKAVADAALDVGGRAMTTPCRRDLAALRKAATPILERCLDFFGADDLDPESSEAMPVVIKNRWVYELRAALAARPDSPALEKNYQDLRVAAQRVLDDWNRVGAQGDGYRALRAALDALQAAEDAL